MRAEPAPGVVPLAGSSPAVTFRTGDDLWETVTAHVLSGDGEEHGGAVLCGIASTLTGIRLLGRRFIPAVDDVDYVPGIYGHRALTPSFIRRVLRSAADQNLICLFVHGHGHGSSVAFSRTDLASHERGYPALLDIAGQHVGALVLADNAVAGDIWLTEGGRADIATSQIIGTNVRSLTPRPVAAPAADGEDSRQVQLFGDRGRQILRAATIGVIGAGGAGMLAVQLLSLVGVGHLVVIDPDRVEPSNLPRLPGATRADARLPLTAAGRPRWVQDVGRRLATKKTRVAARLTRQAGQGTRISVFPVDVRDAAAATALLACDYLVLAADTATARHLVNVISYQYLIPMVQVGVKIPVDSAGTVGDLFAVTRPVTPDGGCLRCAGLIDATALAIESLPDAQRRLADYGTGEPAPSVITLNAIAVSHAVNDVMFALTGLRDSSEVLHVRHHARRGTQVAAQVRSRDPGCPVCGDNGLTALGDLALLPLPRS